MESVPGKGGFLLGAPNFSYERRRSLCWFQPSGVSLYVALFAAGWNLIPFLYLIFQAIYQFVSIANADLTN